jgi:hypothetical protein
MKAYFLRVLGFILAAQGCQLVHQHLFNEIAAAHITASASSLSASTASALSFSSTRFSPRLYRV